MDGFNLRKASQDLGSLVGASVIDHDQIPAIIQDLWQKRRKKVPVVISGDQDAATGPGKVFGI
jgi:hypothetical protein